ncbi:hypothetical protein BST20_05495 [Mycobacterium branderi]|uniref:Uncharacterized protein n=1 Tax=Mycobacterium branderi TaxID=43348 RepID=A0AA91RKC1_9MYCO|nr:hypothetical protein BST20_05495 [Mycobacterium branderi]
MKETTQPLACIFYPTDDSVGIDGDVGRDFSAEAPGRSECAAENELAILHAEVEVSGPSRA